MSLVINSREQQAFRQRQFAVDCIRMELRQYKQLSPRIYLGAGELRQTADGSLEFVLYDTTTDDTFIYAGSPAGTWVSHDEYFFLTARSLDGREWKAEWVHPSVSSSYEHSGVVARGRLRELRCTKEVPQAASGLLAFASGAFDVPVNSGTESAIEIAGRTISRAFERNIWKLKTSLGQMILAKVAGGIEVTLPSVSQPIPADIMLRLQEALTFVLARPLIWLQEETIANGIASLTLRSFPRPTASPRLMPPLLFKKYSVVDDVSELFRRYIDFLLCSAPKQGEYHSLGVNVARVLRASGSTVDDEALALSVELENLIRTQFESVGTPPPEFRTQVDQFVEELRARMPESDLLDRAIGNVQQFKGTHPGTALRHLVHERVLTSSHVKAWSALRNRSAHGLRPSDPIQETVAKCNLVYQAMLLLIFQRIGYSRTFTDYTIRDWPMTRVGGTPGTELPYAASVDDVDPTPTSHEYGELK